MPVSPEVAAALADCSGSLGLENSQDSETLEKCTTYYILRRLGFDEKEASDSLERLSTGGADDGGLDGIAVIANGALLTPESGTLAISDALEAGDDLTIDLIFIQATAKQQINKRGSPDTPKLTNKIDGFNTGIQKILTNYTGGLGQRVQDWGTFCKAILDLASGRDNCTLNCLARLVWPKPLAIMEQHEQTIEQFKGNIGNTVPGINIDYVIYDETGFNTLVSERYKPVDGVLPLACLSRVPDNGAGITSYFGTVPATSFIDLISTPDPHSGKRILKPKLFDLNVRSYLGDAGGVNRQIRESLLDPVGRRQFHLRNNGVSVITDKVSALPGSTTIQLSDYQIVNGQQTSRSLLRTLDKIGDDIENLFIPIRIIVTSNAKAVDNIVIGLNQQKEVEEIYLFSRRPFAIGLARFIDQLNTEGQFAKISFERRAFEHREGSDRKKTDPGIVEMEELLRAYGAMFARKPENFTRTQDLVKALNDGRLFNEYQAYDFYFMSALAITHWQRFINNPGFGRKKIPWNYGARNQVFMAFQLLCEKSAQTKVTAQCLSGGAKADTILKSLSQVTGNQTTARRLMKNAFQIVDKTLREDRKKPGELSRSADFSNRIRQQCG